jgi:hypothetical protein
MNDRFDNVRKPLRKRMGVLLTAAVGALVIVGVVAAANSASYTDPQGDVSLAPDIIALDVANDDTGTITIRMTTAGDIPIGLPGEDLGVLLDLDQNPDTGTVFYGTEVAMVFQDNSLRFERAAGNAFTTAPSPPSLQGATAINGGVVTFSVKAADLGLTPSAGFNVVAISASNLTGELDSAPDIRTFNYQQVAGTPPPVLGPDTRPPLDRAFASHGVHGKTIHLDYWAADGRGVTADTLRVYRRGRLLRTIRTSLGDASPFIEYYARWHAPRTVRGKLRFCVQSTDAAGNKSNSSCTKLLIR